MTNRTERPRLGVAAFWLKGMAQVFRDTGVDVAAVFQEAGLDLAALNDPDARFSDEMLNRIWRIAVRRSGDPAIGLAAARVPRPMQFDVVGYAMMSAPDLLGLLDRLTRYFRVISDIVTFTVTEDPEGYRARLDLSGGEEAPVWQRYAFALMSMLTFIRWIMSRDLRPLAVELTTTAQAEVQPYQAAFECPLHCGAAVNALLFSRSDMDVVLPTAQPRLVSVHERVVGEYLARLDHTRISVRVRAAIPNHLADGEPRRAEVARALGMSERTLQRRLDAEGTSFRLILDDTRKELARKYFELDHLSLAHIAYLLGFDDQSSLFRAIRRWFGMTPRQYRRRRDTNQSA